MTMKTGAHGDPYSLIRKGLLFFFCAFVSVVAASADGEAAASCRSNSTHIAWMSYGNVDAADGMVSFTIRHRRHLDSKDEKASPCTFQLLADAQTDAMKYLSSHIMAFDRPKFHTMGFVDAKDTVSADGLDYGLVGPTIRLALQAKSDYFWADALPRSIFYEYVLNYAHLNEARSDWRQLIQNTIFPDGTTPISEALHEIVHEKDRGDTGVVDDVVKIANTHIWSMLSRDPNKPLKFVSSQTPLIFDPMSVISFGYASCTGFAILFASVLRTIGIAARVVGTPAWHGDRDQGNHNWIEVYDYASDTWLFLEPSLNGGSIDHPNKQPCERWFCHPANMDGGTRVYAARLEFDQESNHCPLAWEWPSKDVPGIDRTDYYMATCMAC